MQKRPLMFALILGLALAIGCGDDEPEKDNNTTNNINNLNNANNENNTNNENNFENTAEYLDAYQLRFESLVFDQGSAGFSLNSILSQNFDQQLDVPIVVLVELRSIDAEAGSFEIRGGSGLKTETEGSYEWDPGGEEVYEPGQLVAETGAVSGTITRLDFVATIPTETDVQKVVIPIRELQFEGNLVLNEDGSEAEIPNGRLEGYLTREDGDMTEIRITPTAAPVSVTNLFREDNLNYDVASQSIVPEGEGDAWYLTADFSAIQTTIVE